MLRLLWAVAASAALGFGWPLGDPAPFDSLAVGMPEGGRFFSARNSSYGFVFDLEAPGIVRLSAGGGIVSEEPSAFELWIDGQRRVLGGRGRVNIYDFGPYLYEIHVRDLVLGGDDSEPRDVDVSIYAHARRLFLNVTVRAEKPCRLGEARLLLPGSPCLVPGGVGLRCGEGLFAVMPTHPEGAAARACADGVLVSFPPVGPVGLGGTATFGVALAPASDAAEAQAWIRRESHPLPRAAFEVKGGVLEGYDATRGFYLVRTLVGRPIGFEAAHRVPSDRVEVRLKVRGDGRDALFCVYNDYGTLEAAVLADGYLAPLPVPVQVGKNFGGEKEEGPEEGDQPFGRSYFPVSLPAGETKEFVLIHLFANWGQRPLKQVSSIRFFRHYLHISTGPTETLCHTLFPFVPRPDRSYSVCDFRAMSARMWPGQPQHDHVCLVGWLRYLGGDGVWHHLSHTNTTFYHLSPCLAAFRLDYESDDGKVAASVESFEAPTVEETRAFCRVRYEALDDVTLGGPVEDALRLVCAGSYILRHVFPKAAWLGADGTVHEADVPTDGSLAVAGEPLSEEAPFTCLYPHPSGNVAFIVRSFRASLGGETLRAPALSVRGFEDTTEMFLTLPPGTRLAKGDWVEMDVVLLPFGTERHDWRVAADERERFCIDPPRVAAVHRGTKQADFPSWVRAQDGVAEVTLAGGTDWLPLIVDGFPDATPPLVFEYHHGWLLMDAQIRGLDYYQVYPSREGGCGFVIPVRTRKGQTHRVLVAQPRLGAPLVALRSDNGYPEIELASEAGFDVLLPHPVFGAEAVPEGDFYRSRGTGAVLRCAPMAWEGEGGLRVEEATPERGSARVGGAGLLRLEGLLPNRRYLLGLPGGEHSQAADAAGRLTVRVDGAGPVSYRLASAGPFRVDESPKPPMITVSVSPRIPIVEEGAEGAQAVFEWENLADDPIVLSAYGPGLRTDFKVEGGRRHTERVGIPVPRNRWWGEAEYRTRTQEGFEFATRLRAVRSFAAPMREIAVDGNLSDWEGALHWCWGAVRFRFGLSWDLESLYAAFEVPDEVHRPGPPNSSLWQGDSVQLALDPAFDRAERAYAPDDCELGVALLGEPVVWCWKGTPSIPEGRVGDLLVAASRLPDRTVYEIAIPWDRLPPLAPKEGAVFGAAFLANDEDGEGRRYLEPTPAIAAAKDPSIHIPVRLAP